MEDINTLRVMPTRRLSQGRPKEATQTEAFVAADSANILSLKLGSLSTSVFNNRQILSRNHYVLKFIIFYHWCFEQMWIILWIIPIASAWDVERIYASLRFVHGSCCSIGEADFHWIPFREWKRCGQCGVWLSIGTRRLTGETVKVNFTSADNLLSFYPHLIYRHIEWEDHEGSPKYRLK